MRSAKTPMGINAIPVSADQHAASSPTGPNNHGHMNTALPDHIAKALRSLPLLENIPGALSGAFCRRARGARANTAATIGIVIAAATRMAQGAGITRANPAARQREIPTHIKRARA